MASDGISELESVQDFFYQVGHETMYASSENKHFSLNLVIVRLTKIMNRGDKNFRKKTILKIKIFRNIS